MTDRHTSCTEGPQERAARQAQENYVSGQRREEERRSARIEAMARALAPKAWATYGVLGEDTLAQGWRRKASIRHAGDALLASEEFDRANPPDAMAGTHR